MADSDYIKEFKLVFKSMLTSVKDTMAIENTKPLSDDDRKTITEAKNTIEMGLKKIKRNEDVLCAD